MRWTVLFALVLLFLLGARDPLWASSSGRSAPRKHDEGELDRFEREATRSGTDRNRDRREGRGKRGHDRDEECDCDEGCDCDDSEDFASAFFWELGRASFYTGIYGGVGSWVRVQGSSSRQWGGAFPLRTAGEPLIPFLSVEGQAQDVGSFVSATEVRAEAGYGPFGFEYRTTCYRERHPEDALTVTRAHFLYRMSFSQFVELDLGPGYATISGNRSTTGFSLTTPLRVYPVSALGVELRPSWAWMGGSTISDCSLLAVARRSLLSVKAGYRWASAGDADLDGPVVGVAVNF